MKTTETPMQMKERAALVAREARTLQSQVTRASENLVASADQYQRLLKTCAQLRDERDSAFRRVMCRDSLTRDLAVKESDVKRLTKACSQLRDERDAARYEAHSAQRDYLAIRDRRNDANRRASEMAEQLRLTQKQYDAECQDVTRLARSNDELLRKLAEAEAEVERLSKATPCTRDDIPALVEQLAEAAAQGIEAGNGEKHHIAQYMRLGGAYKTGKVFREKASAILAQPSPPSVVEAICNAAAEALRAHTSNILTPCAEVASYFTGRTYRTGITFQKKVQAIDPGLTNYQCDRLRIAAQDSVRRHAWDRKVYPWDIAEYFRNGLLGGRFATRVRDIVFV